METVVLILILIGIFAFGWFLVDRSGDFFRRKSKR